MLRERIVQQQGRFDLTASVRLEAALSRGTAAARSAPIRTARVLAMPPPKQKPTTPTCPCQWNIAFSQYAAARKSWSSSACQPAGKVAHLSRHRPDSRRRSTAPWWKKPMNCACPDGVPHPQYGVQAPVLVYHENCGQVPAGLRRPDQVSTNLPIALWRGHRYAPGGDGAVTWATCLAMRNWRSLSKRTAAVAPPPRPANRLAPCGTRGRPM